MAGVEKQNHPGHLALMEFYLGKEYSYMINYGETGILHHHIGRRVFSMLVHNKGGPKNLCARAPLVDHLQTSRQYCALGVIIALILQKRNFQGNLKAKEVYKQPIQATAFPSYIFD